MDQVPGSELDFGSRLSLHGGTPAVDQLRLRPIDHHQDATEIMAASAVDEILPETAAEITELAAERDYAAGAATDGNAPIAGASAPAQS